MFLFGTQCKCCVSNVDELKQRLAEVWDDLQQTVIDSAVSQWIKTASEGVSVCTGTTF